MKIKKKNFNNFIKKAQAKVVLHPKIKSRIIWDLFECSLYTNKILFHHVSNYNCYIMLDIVRYENK